MGFVACWPNLLKLSCHVHPINEMDTLNLDFVDFDPCEIGSYLPEVIEIECLWKTVVNILIIAKYSDILGVFQTVFIYGNEYS